MVSSLIGIHAALGEIAIFAFIWVFIELLNPSEQRIKRAKKAAVIGVILFFMSWIVGGYYYVNYYGKNVKPIIKEGPVPWAHEIFTETKEHIFLFLPFLSILTLGLIHKSGKALIKDKKTRSSILTLTFLIVLIGLAMAVMGYLISTGARAALEAKLL
ncbi:hypothetical protein HY500_03270 [Candidatus Woesearchaeota archaeon]|nr:hypothetical protein [Candidatus Woesearchaeota archaeon]